MSHYTSADALLADIRLHGDALARDGLGMLVVEGPNDKRLFARHVVSLAQIFSAGGRRPLLAAHERTGPTDHGHTVFLTDCDYEVRRGTLSPKPGLLITSKVDVESDLIDLGLLASVVMEIVPAALGSERHAIEITLAALNEATEFALPLGRMRMAAQPLGIPLELEKINHIRHWDKQRRTVDHNKLSVTVHSRLRGSGTTMTEWLKLIDATPDDVDMCHGKDLIRAFYFSLRRQYSLPDDISPESICRLLRANLWQQDLARWNVGQRIRRWESDTNLRILKYDGHGAG